MNASMRPSRDAQYDHDPSVGGAAGSLQSTGHDLFIFAKALADGTLLSPASSSAMHTFVPGEDYSQFGIRHGYGLGIEEYASDMIDIIGHMGTGDAQSAFFGYDPQHGTAVAVMTNTALAGPQAIRPSRPWSAPARSDEHAALQAQRVRTPIVPAALRSVTSFPSRGAQADRSHPD